MIDRVVLPNCAEIAIVKEMRGAIEFDDFCADYRHLALLCDLVAHRR